ncbi:MAG: RNA polymerase sigma factor [Cyclobacteriaceae bacterium]
MTPALIKIYSSFFYTNLWFHIKQNFCIETAHSYTKKEVKSLEDSEIVDLILARERPELFEEIYDRYALKIFRKCLSFTKDESEAKDLAHDVIVKIYLNLSKYGKKSKFSTWIYAITFNYCVDHQAKKKKQHNLSEQLKYEEQNRDSETDPSDEEIMGINIETLKVLLEKLSVAEKGILLMKYQDGLSIKEIANLIDAGESSVKMKLKRTKAKLIKLYEDGK